MPPAVQSRPFSGRPLLFGDIPAETHADYFEAAYMDGQPVRIELSSV